MRLLAPLTLLALALLTTTTPPHFGNTSPLALSLSLLALMTLLADLIPLSLGAIFNPYSHFWCFLIAPGTILHEIGHLLACWTLRVPVSKVRLFQPNPHTGQLGYVNFQIPIPPSPITVTKGLIIGIAPFISGAATIAALLALLAPDVPWPPIDPNSPADALASLQQLALNLAHEIQHNSSLGHWRWPILALALSIGSGAAPSSTDLAIPFKLARRSPLGGLLTLLIIGAIAAAAIAAPHITQRLTTILILTAAAQTLSLAVILLTRLALAPIRRSPRASPK